MARFPVLKIEPLIDKNTNNTLLPDLNEFGFILTKNSLLIYIRIQMFFVLLSVCSLVVYFVPFHIHPTFGQTNNVPV